MKDYKEIAVKIGKMGHFRAIYQCGSPSNYHPVNLYCELSEAYVIGYKFYVSYSPREWGIDYSLDTSIDRRADMTHISGIKTDKEMYAKVQEVIDKIREHCGVKKEG